MKNFVNKLVGVVDEVSSKRVIGVLGALVLMGTMVANSFLPQDIAPSKELVEAQYAKDYCEANPSAAYCQAPVVQE